MATEVQLREIQKIIDEQIVREMVKMKGEFQDYFQAHYSNKNIVLTEKKYDFTPFELFSIEKMASIKVGIHQMGLQISNEVKLILNEFVEKVEAE